MTRNAHQRTSISSLMGVRVLAADGTIFGRIREFAVYPESDPSHVDSLVVQRGKESKRWALPVGELQLSDSTSIQLTPDAAPLEFQHDETCLLLERDLLDQQIIDINGHKVVRVNDVDLVWEHNPDGLLALRIAEVEVGLRGAIRRLLKGLPGATVDGIATRLGPSVIPWDFVDLIERDPARRVRLKIKQDRLSKMHPSDLADILEELGPAERHALFSSLDEEVAAEALEEVQPRMQKALIESLDSERVAGIVEEMDPGAAADLLSELPDERSDAILEEMDPVERKEVEELLEFSGDSAAGRMTTEYVALPADALVGDAVEALRAFEGDLDIVTDVYLLDAEHRIHGLVPLSKLLLATSSTPLNDIRNHHVLTCPEHMAGKKVAELFDKYNLRSLPVVDEAGTISGVIHAEQVIALLREHT